jgi:hypothetical protein
MKSFPIAEIIARIMYIVRRKGMRLAAMVKSDVEKLMMCPKLDLRDLHAVPNARNLHGALRVADNFLCH